LFDFRYGKVLVIKTSEALVKPHAGIRPFSEAADL